MQQISRTVSQQMETFTWNCSDKCSTDLFLNASCLNIFMKTTPTARPSANQKCTQTLTSHCRSVLFSRRLLPLASMSYAVCTSSQMDDAKCKSHRRPTKGGKCHSCHQQQGHRVEEHKHICGPHANAGGRCAPTRTNVETWCSQGILLSQ